MASFISRKEYSIYDNGPVFTVALKKSAMNKGTLERINNHANGKRWTPTVSYNKEIAKTIDDAEMRFLSDLEKGIAIRRRENKTFVDLGVMRIYNGKLAISQNKSKPTEECKEEQKEEPKTPEREERTPLGFSFAGAVANEIAGKYPMVVADPSCEYAKSLIGKNVEISRSFTFTDCKRIVLTNIEKDSPYPFYGKSIEDGKQVSGVFIREYHVVRLPLDLDDKAVRDTLRGKWIFNKVTGQECLVSSFRKDDGHYKCNGLDARTLMNSWELEDGGFLGVEK